VPTAVIQSRTICQVVSEETGGVIARSGYVVTETEGCATDGSPTGAASGAAPKMNSPTAMKLTDVIPPPTETLELPVDVLALRLLRYFCANEDVGGGVSQNIVINAAHWSEYEPMQEHRDPFMRALREAWDWLYVHGLLGSPVREERSFVTRRGRAVASQGDGLAWLRAERRLDVDLHPSIGGRVRPQWLLGEYEAAAFLAMREVESACVTSRERPAAISVSRSCRRRSRTVARSPIRR
jgi:hypothetical protein